MSKRIIRVLECLICLLIIVSFGGCTENDDYKSNNEFCEASIFKVVEIKVCDDNDNIIGYGTGTIISQDGKIITNRHVISHIVEDEYVIYQKLYARFYNEEDYISLRFETISETYDFALLSFIEEKEYDAFEIGDSKKLKFGDDVFTIGNNNAFGLAFCNGSIGAPLRTVLYNDESINAIQTTLLINEGNSGGPLIDAYGKLVGITTFRLRDKKGDIIVGISFALGTDELKTFIK